MFAYKLVQMFYRNLTFDMFKMDFIISLFPSSLFQNMLFLLNFISQYQSLSYSFMKLKVSLDSCSFPSHDSFLAPLLYSYYSFVVPCLQFCRRLLTELHFSRLAPLSTTIMKSTLHGAAGVMV